MICRLCLNEKELRESHVIPQFAARWLKDNSATGYLRQAINPNLRRQDLQTELLLCEDCENIFSRWEKIFAESIFYPYLNDRKLEFEYSDWLLKFAVSLIWRLGITELEDFREYKPRLVGDLEKALSRWRKYLLSEDAMKVKYGFHLFFLDFVKSSTGGSVPEGLHWYILSGVDGTIPASNTEVYGYVKLPALAFFAGIKPRFPTGLKNTQILERGKIRASNQIISSPVFGEFFLDRAKSSWELTKSISEKQRQKIHKAIISNPEKSVNSHSFQVFLAEQYWKNK